MANKNDGAKKDGEKKKKSGRSSCRKILLVLAVVVVPLGTLIHYVVTRVGFILQNVQNAGANAVLLNRCVTDIRNAEQEYQPWYFQWAGAVLEYPGSMPTVFYEGIKALFGLNFVHRTVTSGVEHLFLYPQDEESRMCRAMLNYMWVSPYTSAYSYPSIYAGYEQQKGWIKACKAEWPNLGDEEKRLLQPFRAAGDFPMELLVPEVDRNDELKATARSQKEFPLFENSEKMTREDIVDMLRKSIATSQYIKHVGEEPPETAIDYYMSMNMRKAIEIPATWEAVGKAIRAGEITKFDARGLLPKELFNVSFRTMKQWEGPAATRIPIFGDGRVPASFAHWVNEKDAVLTEAFSKSPFNVADTGATTVNGKPSYDDAVRIRIWNSLPPSPAGYIHTRRLPEFHKKLPNVEKLMGIEEDVLRGQSMLWLGSTAGGFHYDEEANVYVQLTGETFAFLVPQNWTDYFTGAIRHPWHSQGLPGTHEVEKDPELKNVPIYLIHLQPGDGITLHGRTYHRFMAQTTDRISLNWFFIPKWRRMEYNPADWYSLEAKRSLTRLALRQLWARTLSRLFDDTGMGVVYMGTKLEYI